jgi:hypothetical protein
MIDFNNPYLTLQQKQDILSSIAQGHKVRQKTDADAPDLKTSFKSHWILKMRDLWHLNNMGSMKLTTTFVLDQCKIKKYYPDFSVILFESDRVEKGEWDNFEGKWATAGYQHTLVLGCNGFIASANDQGCKYLKCDLDLENETNNQFVSTIEMINCGQDMFPIGLLDIPLEDISQHEGQRIHEKVSSLSDAYASTLKSAINGIRATTSFSKDSIHKCKKRGFGY